MFSLIITVQSIARVAEILANPDVETALSAHYFINEHISLELIRIDCDPVTGPPDEDYILVSISPIMRAAE